MCHFFAHSNLKIQSWIYGLNMNPAKCTNKHMNTYWLMVSTPLKNMKVSWDDDIPNIWENRSHVPNHQPEYVLYMRTLSKWKNTMIHDGGRLSHPKINGDATHGMADPPIPWLFRRFCAVWGVTMDGVGPKTTVNMYTYVYIYTVLYTWLKMIVCIICM